MSDGHKLNFPVINPWTGKAERPTLVTWFEAAARMPVGFDIDFTENKRVIMSSFRNALIASGYCPKYVKLDNGKAFRSKEFSARASKLRGSVEDGSSYRAPRKSCCRAGKRPS